MEAERSHRPEASRNLDPKERRSQAPGSVTQCPKSIRSNDTPEEDNDPGLRERKEKSEKVCRNK